MANLTMNDKELLEELLKMRSGYVLDFSDRTFEEFFKQELGIDIFDEKYNYHTGSKANRMRAFWKIESDELVARCIIKLLEYIELKVDLGKYVRDEYPEKLIEGAKALAKRLYGGIDNPLKSIRVTNETNYSDGVISIQVNDEVFSHVKNLLSNGHYFNAVEESFKIVRNKLKQKTGEEKATDAFKKENFKIIFGHEPKNTSEKDFFEGVKFLHMAIQFFRNEKAHTPAYEIDKNLALHYIVLASLAYEFISRSDKNE